MWISHDLFLDFKERDFIHNHACWIPMHCQVLSVNTGAVVVYGLGAKQLRNKK